MKPIIFKCPKCGCQFGFTNYLWWIWYAPMHWLGKRYTKCHMCGQRSWIKREKENENAR